MANWNEPRKDKHKTDGDDWLYWLTVFVFIVALWYTPDMLRAVWAWVLTLGPLPAGW